MIGDTAWVKPPLIAIGPYGDYTIMWHTMADLHQAFDMAYWKLLTGEDDED